MSNIADRLRIKYGLGNNPSGYDIHRWARLVRTLVQAGYSMEEAGSNAAQQLFPDFNSVFYASEADTIEALLRVAEKK